MGKKTKVLLAWLGFELAGLIVGLPAGAQILDRVLFKAVPRAAHVVTPISPTKTEVLIASNAPFMLISEGAVGEMKLDLQVTGQVNGVVFGKNAQNPGPILSCVLPVSEDKSILYLSSQKTAANRGEVIDQAVRITITHAASPTPAFSVITLDQLNDKNIMPALPCPISIG